MRNKPIKRSTAVTLSILSAMLAAFLGLAVYPHYRQNSLLRQEISDRQNLWKERIAQSQQLAIIIRKNQLMEGAVRTYDRLVPDKQNLGPFLGQLSTELDAAGMQNTAVRALTKTNLGKCEQWPIEVRGSGNFEQVHRFLRSLENLPRLSSVTRLNLENDPNMAGTVTTELTLSIYNTRPN